MGNVSKKTEKRNLYEALGTRNLIHDCNHFNGIDRTADWRICPISHRGYGS